MKLKEALEAIRHTANEIDIKVCYNNDFDEECTLCRTFVDEAVYKEGKTYWASKVTKYAYSLNTKEMERYLDFEVGMLCAKGKNHFFIFASNFH